MSTTPPSNSELDRKLRQLDGDVHSVYDLLADLGRELASVVVEQQGQRVTLDAHTGTLATQGETLDSHTATLDEHTGMLAEILDILRRRNGDS
ncbi:MAG: hypothetical protein M3063_09345 [Actinomycetota bacterium]|nr:hypothetical protein [Actinomycetota bacterium]MDQ6949843.1 hypothetical protein [Actinomycetota bacterium]